MNTTQKNTALVAAVVSGLVSLPLMWFTIPDAHFQDNGGLDDVFNSASSGMTISATGLNGYVGFRFLLKTPLWFVVCVSIGASLLQLMRNAQAFVIPRIVEWIAAIVGVSWTMLPVALTLFGKASLGMGWLLRMLCAATPLACLILTSASTLTETTKNGMSPSGGSGGNKDHDNPAAAG